MSNSNTLNHANNNTIINGDQTINNFNVAEITIDVGKLRYLCETHAEGIAKLLSQFNVGQKIEYDDAAIRITTKNSINELEKFYENFIKDEESKLSVLDSFFKENNLTQSIAGAAKSIKIAIFSFKNRNSNKLTSELFGQIIYEHTIAIEDSEYKEIMQLIIFYLYRYCYIGEKTWKLDT